MRYAKKQLPLVVIFGRTNVGKSTLFNCLIEKQQALVTNIEGTTRDSNIGQVDWWGKTFELVDTGGIIDLKYLTGKKLNTEDIEAKVQKQARDYLQRADLVLFLVDNKTGLLPQDKQMALLLKKILPKTNNILLIANKTDSLRQYPKNAEFYKLSLGEPIPVSAANGSGTGDLLDIIVKGLSACSLSAIALERLSQPRSASGFKAQAGVVGQPAGNNESEQLSNSASEIKVCIIGKPNVGKSSLLNSVLGYERVIVSPVPHTTREPQDTDIVYKNQLIKLIDTAGISKQGAKGSRLKKNYPDKIIKNGIDKSLARLKKSDIALLVMDISQPITRQDAKLVEEIVIWKKSLIFIANKWDKIAKRDTKQYTNCIYANLPFAQFAPIQFTSALTGEKVKKALDLILEINEQRQLSLSDSQLNHFLNRVVKLHKPAKGKGTKHPRLYSLKQIKANPPKFEIHIGAKDNLHFSYVRFIENRLREKYGFLGTPLTIYISRR